MFSFQLFIFKRNYLENGRRQSNSERKIICHMEYVLSQEAAYQISEQSDKKKIKCNTFVVAQTSFEKKQTFFSKLFFQWKSPLRRMCLEKQFQHCYRGRSASLGPLAPVPAAMLTGRPPPSPAPDPTLVIFQKSL